MLSHLPVPKVATASKPDPLLFNSNISSATAANSTITNSPLIDANHIDDSIARVTVNKSSGLTPKLTKQTGLTQPDPLSASIHRPSILHEPTAYVVLGGGLTEATRDSSLADQAKKKNPDTPTSSTLSASNKQPGNKDNPSRETVAKETPTKDNNGTKTNLTANTIVLNAYSLNRMKTVVAHYQKRPLPIIVTGVEAPWMRDWLLNQGIDNVVTENASMNTCENARFTAKRLKLTNVYLITDAYHMTRTRRQFALNNIQTTPIPAPLPMQKGWLQPKNNAQHSRRTLYELAAYTRDVIAPQQNCRQADDVSFATLLHSRKPEDVKTF